MAITDKDRKLLWGRSHNRCAYCQELLSIAERPDDRAAIVGDEAHIVSDAPNGPRSTMPIDVGIDSYENLILLCRVHHKMVDDQPNEFTVERLIKMKRDHEVDTEARFSTKSQWTPPPPIRIKKDPSSADTAFSVMRKGSDVWDVIAMAQRWKYLGLDDDGSSEIQQDASDEFLDLVQTYADVSFDVTLSGSSSTRSAKRELGEQLDRLLQLGIVVLGRRMRVIVTGGVLPDDYWMQGELVILRLDDELALSDKTDQ